MRSLTAPVWALVGQRDYRPFIVLCRSRTGSTLLVSMLNSHPQVRCDAEAAKRLNGRPPSKVLDGIYGRQAPSVRAKGFKIFYIHPLDQSKSPIWGQLAGMPDLHVIHLRRRNILRTVVSRKIAGLEGVWTKPTGVERDGEVERVSFDGDELRREFEQTRRWEGQGEARFPDQPMLQMVYEDLEADAAGEFRRATDFLGVPFVAPTTHLQRQHPQPLAELIENYGELEVAFRDTEWAPFFQD